MDRSVAADGVDGIEVFAPAAFDDGIEVFLWRAFNDVERVAAVPPNDLCDIAALRARAAIHDEERLHTVASRWRSNQAAHSGTSHKVRAMITIVRVLGGGGLNAVER